MTRKNVSLGLPVNHETHKFKESSLFFLIRKIPLGNISQLMLHPNLKKRRPNSQSSPGSILCLLAKLIRVLIELLRLLFDIPKRASRRGVFMPYNLTWFIQSEELKLLRRGLLRDEKKRYPKMASVINFDCVKGFETLIDRKVRLYEGEFRDGRWIFGREQPLSDNDDDIFHFYQRLKIKSIFSLSKCQNLTQ